MKCRSNTLNILKENKRIQYIGRHTSNSIRPHNRSNGYTHSLKTAKVVKKNRGKDIRTPHIHYLTNLGAEPNTPFVPNYKGTC
jgi:hypothetical protein